MKLLFLEDDPLLQGIVRESLSDEFKVIAALSYDSGAALLDSHFDIALIDINLADPTHDGVDFLKLLKQRHADLPAVIASGTRDIPVVVNCMRMGADDFIEKPFGSIEGLKLRLHKTIANAKKSRMLTKALQQSYASRQIVGASEGIIKAKCAIERAGEMRILLQGETGVGKTPFAWYSNQVVSTRDASPRPFEQVNCAGLSKEHFEDQLFGHKKGAFTGAIAEKKGLVELANGGDLFLNEIGEMPLDIQALFLTFLDTSEYYRLGDDQKRKASIRVISATNRDLRKMVQEGKFRKDLYSRISQVQIEIPPLRARREDIPLVFHYYLNIFAGFSKPFDSSILEIFQSQTWEDGNVRELRDAVEYMCVMGRDSDVLRVEHLSEQFRPPLLADLPEFKVQSSSKWLFDLAEKGLEQCLNTVEEKVLSHFYDVHGNVDSMAAQLQISKPTLYLQKFLLAFTQRRRSAI